MKRLLAWIVVIAVVALLATVIPHLGKAPAAQAPSAKPAAWHTIATFHGSATGATAPFTTARHWRVVWSAGPPPQPKANFGILVDQPGSDVPYDTLANRLGAGSGTHAETGAGTFYLDVQTAEPYAITVQTYASAPPRQPRYRWHTVSSTSGSASKLISIASLSAPWRINWSATAGTTQGSFAISVLQPGQALPVDFVANVAGGAHAVAYEYQSGAFQLKVAATEPYTITVQEGRKR